MDSFGEQERLPHLRVKMSTHGRFPSARPAVAVPKSVAAMPDTKEQCALQSSRPEENTATTLCGIETLILSPGNPDTTGFQPRNTHW
jgi:hypothetical protein